MNLILAPSTSFDGAMAEDLGYIIAVIVIAHDGWQGASGNAHLGKSVVGERLLAAERSLSLYPDDWAVTVVNFKSYTQRIPDRWRFDFWIPGVKLGRADEKQVSFNKQDNLLPNGSRTLQFLARMSVMERHRPSNSRSNVSQLSPEIRRFRSLARIR